MRRVYFIETGQTEGRGHEKPQIWRSENTKLNDLVLYLIGALCYL